MLTLANVIWGARCGEPARRVLLGETRARDHAYSVRCRRESACDRKAPHRLPSSRLVSTNLMRRDAVSIAGGKVLFALGCDRELHELRFWRCDYEGEFGFGSIGRNVFQQGQYHSIGDV